MRHDGRVADQLRSITIQRPYHSAAPGSLLIQAGKTTILCTASVSTDLPPWKLAAPEPSGWVTAEYNMLPGCTAPRKSRRVDGRGTEIQRLIGRSLRAVVNMKALGPRQITVDCDVLQADGGTRTLSITGGFIALVDAVCSIEAPNFDVRTVFHDCVAAISVGVLDGRCLLDLDYEEDSAAAVDMNVVMTGAGQFVELQGTAERGTFSEEHLTRSLVLARRGIADLVRLQRETLGEKWPLDTILES